MNAWDGARSGEILLADETGQKTKRRPRTESPQSPIKQKRKIQQLMFGRS